VPGTRFEGRTAAVTGAGGFIGGAICRALAAEGARVRGIDLAVPPGGLAPGIELAEADVTDREAVAAALDGAELVVHAAAYVREWGEMEDFVRVNVGGTVTVLDAAARAGVERVVHISSVVVYGYEDPTEQGEGAFRRACGMPYIDTKSASDRIACSRGAVVIRPGDVYGPGSVPWVLRPLELAAANQLAVPGGDEGVMLALYVDDLAEAVLLALERGEPGTAYAVWNDEERVSFERHFSRLAEVAGGRPPRRIPRAALEALGTAMEAWARLRGRPPRFSPRAVTMIDRRGTVSTGRARAELGWRPRVGHEEGMRLTEAWVRERGLA
jgi:nucleoside-diphosphate-sugar epimerase